jgi:5-oxoprolinase (ATP-hydrolysing) subunit A
LCWGAGSLAKGHRDFAVPFSFVRQTSSVPGETSRPIDLNADVGEAATPEDLSRELALFAFVSSVNIACGAHAGNLDTMTRTLRAAHERGIAAGAHPGYADRAHFGRREQSLSSEEIRALVQRQVQILLDLGRREQIPIRHVKAHGALYNQAARNRQLARVIATAVRDINPDLGFYGLAGSELVTAGADVGLKVVAEAFVDRRYRPDGTLVPRTEPDGLLDPDAAVAQALSLVMEQRVDARDGSRLHISPDTLCLHGDTPAAMEIARRVREALDAAGVTVRAPFD